MTQWIVSSSILIVIVALLRLLLQGRIKPTLQYALWGLVLARLLIPVQLGSTPISLLNAVEKAPVVQQMELADQVVHFVYHADGTATGYYEYAPPLDHAEPELPVSKPVPQVFTTQEAQSITRIRDIKGVLTKLWLGGMAVVGLVFVLSNLRFSLGLRKAQKTGQEGGLPVYITDKVDTPCLFGLFRPAIYLPPAVAEETRHRTYSVAHELTHYRHGDALWSVLRALCIVVHWYNPLVWWAAVLSRQDGEIACDEATIARLGESHRADYGKVLVDLTCRKKTDLLQTATTMTGSAKGLKQRISMIVKKPKMALYTLIAVLLAVSVAVGCTFTGGSNPTEDDPTLDSTTETTEDTENSGNNGSTEKTDEIEKLPEDIVGTPLTEDELTAFTQIFAEKPADSSNWYHQLLCVGWRSGFSTPQSVDPAYLFYNGFTRQDSEIFGLTEQDYAFLEAQEGYVPQMDSFKLPAAEMDKVTQAYLGIPLRATNQSTLALLYYNGANDCYYSQHTDYQGMDGFQMIDGKRTDDGSVYLLCRKQIKDFRTYKTEWLLLLRLTPNPGNNAIPYRVYSCLQLPVETKNLTTPAPSAEEYGKVKAGYFPFIYTGRPLMTAYYRIDPTGLEEGKLYVCNASTGRIYLVTNEKVSCFDATSQHLYYVTADGKQVIRCEYDYSPGGNKTIVYTTTGAINSIDHYGTYANDKLLLVEDRSKVVLYRLGTGERKALFTRHLVFDAHYDMDAKRYDSKKSGHVVLWRGLQNEDSENDSWLYFISSNEETWLKKPQDPTAGYQGHISRFSTGVFDGSQLNFYTPMPEDLSGFQKGLLYSYDMLTGIYYQLSDGPVNCYYTTLIQDDLFFGDGNRVIRSSYTGDAQSAIYQGDAPITAVSFEHKKLLVVENEKKAVLYDPTTKTGEVVLEQYQIMKASYYPTADEGFPSAEKGKGRVIVWTGKTAADSPAEQYFYFVDRDELKKTYYG